VAVMESPDHDHEPESPVTEDEDSCFPCKGCGNVRTDYHDKKKVTNWRIDSRRGESFRAM
jgi:hypothetical protein